MKIRDLKYFTVPSASTDRVKQFIEQSDLKPSSMQRESFMKKLIGKRDSGGFDIKHPIFDHECSDHTSMWNKDSKPYVYVSQPYHLTCEGLKDISQFCEQFNLSVHITSDSFYSPGGTLMIEIKKRINI